MTRTPHSKHETLGTGCWTHQLPTFCSHLSAHVGTAVPVTSPTDLQSFPVARGSALLNWVHRGSLCLTRHFKIFSLLKILNIEQSWESFKVTIFLSATQSPPLTFKYTFFLSHTYPSIHLYPYELVMLVYVFSFDVKCTCNESYKSECIFADVDKRTHTHLSLIPNFYQDISTGLPPQETLSGPPPLTQSPPLPPQRQLRFLFLSAIN